MNKAIATKQLQYRIKNIRKVIENESLDFTDKEVDYAIEASNWHFKTLVRLMVLKTELHSSFKARVEFASIIESSTLMRDLKSHLFFATACLSERDYDACFEMGDGQEVRNAISHKAA